MTIYAPRQGNDRLLLGLKGSLNEYELDLLRQRSLAPQRLALCIVELRHRTGRLAIDQAVRALGVEMQHPISDHLKPHVAGPCRIRPPPTVIDHRESQEPAALAGILGKLRQATQLRRIEILLVTRSPLPS